jgi:hypothetical protein
MRGSKTYAALATAAGLALILSVADAAAAPGPSSDVDACANAAEESQPLRKEGKLTQARERLVICARSSCPAFIQKDCSSWLSEVEKTIPSIVIRALDAKGKDLTNVRVLVDGKPLTSKLDGRPLSLDPGEHVFTYETAGARPVTETVLIRQAESNRLVSVTFNGPTSSASASTSTSTAAKPSTETSRSIPTVSWVLGGAGVLLAGAGALLWISGKSDHSSMESGCARTHSCLQDDVDSAQGKLLLGDIALATGVVALGAAVVLAIVLKAPPPAGNSAWHRVASGSFQF